MLKPHADLGGASIKLYCRSLTQADMRGPGHRCMQIIPGLYLGGEAAAVEEVEAGRLPADDFK